MKKVSLILMASLLLASTTLVRAAIARWTFEVNTPADLNNSTTIGPISADEGAGTASGFHASALSDWTTPAGNGSANSLNVDHWSVGDYFQFRVSTVGYTDIGVSWSQTSSSTGPRDFVLQYSTDGVNFFQFGSPYTVLENGGSPNPSWNSSTASSAYNYSVDLSSVGALDNAPDVYFRLVDGSTTAAGGGTVGTGGTSRIDDFTVVPEVQHYALFCALGLIGIAAGREIRRRLRTSDQSSVIGNQ